MLAPLSKIAGFLTLASAAMAGQCHNHNQGAHMKNCVNRHELAEQASPYCGQNWNQVTGHWVDFADSRGNIANIGQIEAFSTVAACQSAFKNVVTNCAENWDGGSWQAYGTVLHINFCRWE